MLKLEKSEELLTGSIAGIIGATAKYLFNEITQLLQLAKYDNNATALGVVLKQWEHNVTYWIFGFIVALIIGAFFGVIIAILFSYFLTSKHYLLKGSVIGIGIWLFNFGVMAKVFNYPEDIKNLLGDVVMMLISLMIYGLVTAYMLKVLKVIK